MATIWRETPDGIAVEPLQVVGGFAVLDTNETFDHERCEVRIVPFSHGSKPKHALLVHHEMEVRVNGWPVIGGIQVLDHKDEISIGLQRMYFSAESQPVIEFSQHDGSRRRPRCPICRAEVQAEQAIVRCPGCSRVYHQIGATGDLPAKPCWTYTTECRFCGHPTSMSGEPTWRPDEDDEQQ